MNHLQWPAFFNDTDILETRQLTILHKIVLHLIPRTLESELEFSTQDLMLSTPVVVPVSLGQPLAQMLGYWGSSLITVLMLIFRTVNARRLCIKLVVSHVWICS